MSVPDLSRFPQHFVWGAATASYQIEGAVSAGGRVPSIWDTFCHTPGRVWNGDTADVAADHYHRVDEDVALLAELGIPAYRFSIAWPRVMDSDGRPNHRGLDFYSRLVDRLLDSGITPVATLYHWDLPQHLEDAGGWTNRETAYRMAQYTATVANELADRVPTWTTLNEPWCSAFLGYGSTINAPGRDDIAAALQAAHHLNLAHGLAASTLRDIAPDAQVMLTLNVHQFRPASSARADRDAVGRADVVSNRIFLDPVLDGRYPEELFAFTAQITDWSFVQPEDLSLIHVRPDLLGLNYYTPTVITADVTKAGVSETGDPTGWPGNPDLWTVPPADPVTAMGWTIDPTGLTELLVRIGRNYPGVPLMVTENGASCADVVRDGTVDDIDRIDYLREHICAVGEAIAAGVDVRGYFVWSFLDCFEWNAGYEWHLGLVHVDRDTMRRTVKRSGYWYRGLIRQFRMSA